MSEGSTVEQLNVRVTAQISDFQANMNRMQKSLQDMQNKMKISGNKGGKALSDGVNNGVKNATASINGLMSKLSLALASAGIAKFGKDCVELGSDLEEASNMVNVVFSGMNKEVDDFASKSVTALGRGEAVTRQQLGTLGAMSKTLGMSKKEALDFSMALMQTSTDLASFYNKSQSEVDTMMKSIFSGETEPFKNIGVDISQAAMEAYMLQNGISGSASELSRLEQAQIRYNMVCQQTADATGDFNRSMNSYANQTRILSANFENLKSSIGRGLSQALVPVIKFINSIIVKLTVLANKFSAVMSMLGFNVQSGGGGSGSGGLTGGIADALGTTDSAIGGIANGLDKVGNAVGGAKNAVDDLGKTADKTAKKLKNMMSIDQINVIKKDNDNNNNSGNSGSGGSSGGSGGAGGAGGADTGAITDGLDDVNNKIDEVDNKAKSVLAELLSPLKTAWANYGEWFLSKWEYFKNAFGYACDSLKKFLISVWNNGGKEFVQHMTEIAIVVGGTALSIGGDILVALGNLWNHLNPDSNPYTRAFIKAMNDLATSARDFIISAGGWFSKFLDLGGQAFLNCIGDIVVIVGTTLAEVLSDAIKFVTAFMNSWLGTAIIKTCALTLNIVAGAIKAVAIVIEKCHAVLLPLIALWGAWKFSLVIAGLGDVTTKCGGLVYALYGVYVNLADSITQFGAWTKSIGVSAVNAIKSFGSALLHPVSTIKTLSSALVANIAQFASWIKTTAVSAVNAVKNFALSIASSVKALALKTSAMVAEKAAMVASMVATNGLTLAQTALNVAMNACPIVLLVSLIAGLIAVVVKIGEKFGWWKAISEALGSVFEWLSEKIGWVWDKIKGFFGWDEAPACEASITEIGTTSETTATQMSNAFGTATSNINQYLSTIGYDSTQLLADVDYATQVINEKFGLLSKSSQDYLTALATNDQATLESMKGNEGAYMEEIKAMYAGLTEEEKNQFYAKYGCIEGVNNDWLNLEGLTYDQLVAKHVAYSQNIESNENLTYQEKQRLIAEHEKAINDSYNNQINTLKGKLNEVKNDESLSKEERVKLAQDLEKQIKDLEGSKAKSAKENVNDVTKTTQEATKTQKSSVEEVTKSQKSALKEVKSSVKDTNNVIKDLSKEAKSNADKIKNAYKGIGKDISNEFKKADNGVKSTFDKIYDKIRDTMNRAKNSVNNLRNTINSFNATLHVKIPHFSMSGSFNAEKGTVPKVRVSYYAKGGIMNRATLMGMAGNNAFIGGENGREAILPLDHNTQWMDGLATKVAGAVVGATQNGNDRPLQIELKLNDGSKLGSVFIKSVHELENITGEEYLLG